MMKPMERSGNPRPINPALRRHHYGPLQPMQPQQQDIFEALFTRLLGRFGR